MPDVMVNLKLDDDLRRDVKVIAAMERTTMREFIQNAIQVAVDAYKEEGKLG